MKHELNECLSPVYTIHSAIKTVLYLTIVLCHYEKWHKDKSKRSIFIFKRTNIHILQLMMGLLYDTHTNIIMTAVNCKGNNNITMPLALVK